MALLLHVLSSVMHRCAHCHPGQRPSPPGVSGGWSPGCARGAGPGGTTGRPFGADGVYLGGRSTSSWPATAVPPALGQGEDDALVDDAAFQLAVGLRGLLPRHGGWGG